MSTNVHDPDDETQTTREQQGERGRLGVDEGEDAQTLGAAGNEALMDPVEEREGAETDPSRLRGDPAEDDM